MIERIHQRMEILNYKKSDLLKRSGLKKSTFYSIFNRNDKNLKIETLIPIAKALEVSIDYLVTGSSEKQTVDMELLNSLNAIQAEFTNLKELIIKRMVDR